MRWYITANDNIRLACQWGGWFPYISEVFKNDLAILTSGCYSRHWPLKDITNTSDWAKNLPEHSDCSWLPIEMTHQFKQRKMMLFNFSYILLIIKNNIENNMNRRVEISTTCRKNNPVINIPTDMALSLMFILPILSVLHMRLLVKTNISCKK